MVGSCSEAAGEEDDELSDEEVALDVGKDEGAVDLDDADATDLDIGLKLPEPGDTDDGASTNLDLDFADFSVREQDISEAGDDEAGPQTFDASIGVPQLGDEDLSDDALGMDGPESSLQVEAPLATQDGDEEGALETVDLFIADESEAPVSDETWTRTNTIPGDFETISTRGEYLLAAGSTPWLGQNQHGSWPDFGGLSSAVLVGSSQAPSIVATTKLGELVRFEHDSATPHVIDIRTPLGISPKLPITLSLCLVEPGDVCLVLSSTGRLASIGKDAVQRLELPARPTTLPNRSDAPVVLAEDETGLCLLRAAGPGAPWEKRSLPARVSRIFLGAPLQLSACGPVVALANRHEGTFVSADGGGHFSPVSGTAASAALTTGVYRGKPSVWVVVSHEVDGNSDLLMIDPEHARAVRVARFETLDPNEDAFAPVTALYFDKAHDALHVGGAFGLTSFRLDRAE